MQLGSARPVLLSRRPGRACCPFPWDLLETVLSQARPRNCRGLPYPDTLVGHWGWEMWKHQCATADDAGLWPGPPPRLEMLTLVLVEWADVRTERTHLGYGLCIGSLLVRLLHDPFRRLNQTRLLRSLGRRGVLGRLLDVVWHLCRWVGRDQRRLGQCGFVVQRRYVDERGDLLLHFALLRDLYHLHERRGCLQVSWSIRISFPPCAGSPCSKVGSIDAPVRLGMAISSVR